MTISFVQRNQIVLNNFEAIFTAVPGAGHDQQVRAALRAFLIPQRAPAREPDVALLASAVATHVQVDGFRVPTWTWGHGPRVLLVHGWSSRASHLGAFVAPLVASGFAVTGYDAPAHGDAPGESSSMAHLGRAVRQVSTAVGPVHAVLAHSVGSPACLWAIRDGMQVHASVHLAGPGTLANVIAGFAHAFNLDTDQAQLFCHAIEVFAGEPIARGAVAALADGVRHGGLIVHDTEDREVPHTESVELNRHWPASTLQLTTGLGHRRLLADSDVIRNVVQFLAQYR